jgi:membrane protein DedA with SNARE-associated domain
MIGDLGATLAGVTGGDGWAGILIGGVAAFAEAILGVGLVLPGEAAVSSIAATTPGAHLPWLVLLVTLGAVAGDHLNYGLGRLLGARLPQSRIVRRIGIRHWDRGVELLRTRGAVALVVSRLLPVVRTLMPAVAGVAHLRYRTFLAASLVGSTLWSLLWVAAGSLVTALLRTELPGALVLVAAAIAVVGVRVRSRRRARRRPVVLPDAEGSEGSDHLVGEPTVVVGTAA